MLKTDSKCPVMRLLCFLLLTLPSTVASLARTAQRSPAASTRLSGAIRPASPAGVLGRRSYRARAGRFRTSPPLCVRMMCGACGGESPGGGAERHHSGSAEEDDCLGASIRELGELAQPLVRGGDLGAAPFAPGSLPELPGGPVLILGAGWVGSRLAARLSQERCARVAVTNRPDWRSRQKEAYFAPVPLNPPPVSRHAFDIDAPETWDALPEPETLGAAVLTFAATADQLRPFWERYLRKVPRTVAYSSTAVYRVDVPGQEVDETTPLRPTARAAADAFLLQRGATVLTISGIFGEAQDARGVCTCFAAYASAGGALNGQKSVNMVHVDDIIAATAHALAAEDALVAGARLNVGGGVFKLHELMSHCKYPQAAEAAHARDDTDLSSKAVLSTRLLQTVMPRDFSFVPPLESAAAAAARRAAALAPDAVGPSPAASPAADSA